MAKFYKEAKTAAEKGYWAEAQHWARNLVHAAKAAEDYHCGAGVTPMAWEVLHIATNFFAAERQALSCREERLQEEELARLTKGTAKKK